MDHVRIYIPFHRLFSFRGPSFTRAQIFDDKKIILPAQYYPGDAKQYYKP